MVVLPELPMQLVLHILHLLPPNAQAFSARLVNKAAHASITNYRLQPASEDLPVWVLQQYLSVRSAAEDQKAFVSRLLNARASAGDLQGVMVLRSQGASWDSSTTAAAAGAGQLGILLYLRAQSPPCAWDITTCNAAAAGGHLEVLHWCRSQQPPAPWGDSTAAAAAAAGHLAVLQWLLKPYTTLRDITSSSLNTPYPTSDQMWQNSLVKAGQTCDGVKQQQEKQRFGVGGGVQGLCNGFVRPEACPWAPWLRCAVAARAGQLHVLRWLRAHGASWDAGVCAAAAAGGHLHVLTWLRSQSPPCPIDSESCFEAASNGHIHILHYLRQHTPARYWDESLCLAAAIEGHLEVMKWLRGLEPACPWVAGMSAAAANSGNRELVTWLRTQGAP